MNATAISRLRMLEIRSKYKRFVGKHQTLFKNRDFMYPGDLQRLSGVKISNTRRWISGFALQKTCRWFQMSHDPMNDPASPEFITGNIISVFQ